MMSTSKHHRTVPDDLETPQSKLVYLSILVLEEATASELQRFLGLSKLTLLPVLTSLASNECIRRTENGYAYK